MEEECDLWLHECATSSADGAFTSVKEQICAMAAPERCSSYLEGNPRLSPSSLWSTYRKRQGPLALGGRSAGDLELTRGVSATANLWEFATKSVPKLGVVLAWNILGWMSAYLVCCVVKKVRARGWRLARAANDAGGNPVAFDGNGNGEIASGAVMNEPAVGVAASESATGVGGSGAENIEVVEVRGVGGSTRLGGLGGRCYLAQFRINRRPVRRFSTIFLELLVCVYPVVGRISWSDRLEELILSG